MPRLTKLTKVNEHMTINRYDNGWMVEIGGRKNDDEWTTAKIICNTEDEVVDLIREYNSMPLE